MRTANLVWFLFLDILISGCALSHAVDSRQNESERVLAQMKTSWRKRAEEFNDTKSFVPRRLAILKELVGELPTDVFDAEFGRICSTNIPKKLNGPHDFDRDYDMTLLEVFVEGSIERRDETRLETLLKANCPSHIGVVPLEFYLARKWPDEIVRLFDWYSEVKSERVRQEVLLCLGRAFASARIQYHDNALFTEKAKLWYKENKALIEVNKRYPHLAGLNAWENRTADQNLFIFKSGQVKQQ